MAGIDGDYLDALLDVPETPVSRSGPPVAKVDDLKTKDPAKRKERFTVQIDPDLVEELRNAAVYFLMAGERASVAGIAETAIRSELERLRDEHFDGAPFPARPYNPPPGRRL